MSVTSPSDGDKAPATWGQAVYAQMGDGYPFVGATYVIFKEGSTHYARNGKDGTIDYSGTNAATVIQAVIDSLTTTDNATIIVHSGQDASPGITLDTTLTLDVEDVPNLNFIFDCLQITTDNDFLYVNGGASTTRWQGRLIGNKLIFPENYSKSAVKLRNVELGLVDINSIYIATGSSAAGSVGIHLIGDGSGCFFNVLRGGDIAGAETGIKLESVGGTDFCNSNKIYDFDIGYMVNGVTQVNGGTATSGNTLTNITVNSPGNGDTGFVNVDGDNCYFACKTIDATGTAVDFNNSGTAYLFGCQFGNSNVTNTGTIQHHGCHFGGTGKLENAGAAAGVADGGTIAHGLGTTPTWATATGSVASEIITVTAVGAANLTVAIKTDAGAAGTNQTIYWRAKKEF